MGHILDDKKNKAQAWGIDLFIGTIIFLFGILVFYFYTVNSPEEGKEIVERLNYDGKFISNIVLSEGYPTDWEEDDVMNIGILTDNKINESKLEKFWKMANSSDGYIKSKRLFKTKYEYYFFLDEMITFNPPIMTFSPPVDKVDGVGNFTFNSTGANNLIKITRLVIYKDKPMTAYFYIYET